MCSHVVGQMYKNVINLFWFADSDVCGNVCEYSCFSYTTATSFAKYGYEPLSMLIEYGILIHHAQGFFSAVKMLSKDYSTEESYRIIQSACLSVL